MNFLLYFHNVILKWPMAFKEIDHGVLELLVHILWENHPVPLEG